MSVETLELIMRKALQRPRQYMAFSWQGGEPTLMGLDFFREVIRFEQKYGAGMHVANSMQTNGILIDESWTSFFKKYRFVVGLSIDGPESVHDRYRLDYAVRPSHAQVERAADLLLSSKVEVNALAAVTEQSSYRTEEIYTYLKSLGFTYMQFIPILEMTDSKPMVMADYSVTPKSYGRFLCELFDLWVQDFSEGRPSTSIRQFENYAAIYMGYDSPECTERKRCGDYLVVEHNGDIFSCDFFVEDAWRLGSVYGNASFEQILNGKRQTLFGELKTKLDNRCLRCAYLRFCYGGCPKDRLRSPSFKRFNPYCESVKMFFDYADNRFRALVRQQVAGSPRSPLIRGSRVWD